MPVETENNKAKITGGKKRKLKPMKTIPLKTILEDPYLSKLGKSIFMVD